MLSIKLIALKSKIGIFQSQMLIRLSVSARLSLQYVHIQHKSSSLVTGHRERTGFVLRVVNVTKPSSDLQSAHYHTEGRKVKSCLGLLEIPSVIGDKYTSSWDISDHRKGYMLLDLC